MKGMFSFLGLLLVVAIVGFLAKRQFSEMSRASVPPPAASASVHTPGVPQGTPAQQGREVEKAVQGLMQQTRPMPEDK